MFEDVSEDLSDTVDRGEEICVEVVISNGDKRLGTSSRLFRV